MDNEKTKSKPIKNVICDVVSCCYHDGIGHCTAKQIAIGPIEARCCSDTVCATYKPQMNGK